MSDDILKLYKSISSKSSTQIQSNNTDMSSSQPTPLSKVTNINLPNNSNTNDQQSKSSKSNLNYLNINLNDYLNSNNKKANVSSTRMASNIKFYENEHSIQEK